MVSAWGGWRGLRRLLKICEMNQEGLNEMGVYRSLLFLTSCSQWDEGVEFHYSYTIKANIGATTPPPTIAGFKKEDA